MALEDLSHFARDGSIAREIRSDQDRIATQTLRAHRRHGRTNSESSGFVRCGANNRTIATPSDNYRFTAQLRIVALLDRRIKRVHIYMDDFSHRQTLENLIPGRVGMC